MGDTATGSWGSNELGRFIRREAARNYQEAITIGDLRKFIKDLPDDAKLMIHDEGDDLHGDVHVVQRTMYWRESSIASRELIFKAGPKVEY